MCDSDYESFRKDVTMSTLRREIRREIRHQRFVNSLLIIGLIAIFLIAGYMTEATGSFR